MRSDHTAFPARRAGRAALLGLVLAAVGLAGCATDQTTTGSVIPEDYRQRHPIIVSEQLETLDLPAEKASPRLSNRMRGNITGFAQKYLASNATKVAVVAPSGAPNATAARRVSQEAARALIDAGIPQRAIVYRSYGAEAGEINPPVRLAFARTAAHVEGCGQWPPEDQTFAANYENRSPYNFGCATQQNLAAAVVDPLDLLYPRGMSPPDAGRRSQVLDAYRAGANPSGQYDTSGGSIVTGVGN